MSIALFALIGASLKMRLGIKIAYWICFGFFCLFKLTQACGNTKD